MGMVWSLILRFDVVGEGGQDDGNRNRRGTTVGGGRSGGPLGAALKLWLSDRVLTYVAPYSPDKENALKDWSTSFSDGRVLHGLLVSMMSESEVWDDVGGGITV